MNTTKMRLTDRKRRDILAAAVSEFQEHGYDKTSMDHIAKVASVSKRTVYNHFESKDALFAAMVEELLEHLQELQMPYQPEVPIGEQLADLGQKYAELMTGVHFIKLSRIVLSRFLQNPPQAQLTLGEHGNTEKSIATWMSQAKSDGTLAINDPMQAATELTALINAFAYWPQLIKGSEPLDHDQQRKVISNAVAIFLDHYRA